MQNDMRDRLIELYKEATTLYFDYLDSIDEKGLTDTEGRAKFTIDHLIANGVVLPPCKVGDTVYCINTFFLNDPRINKCEVDALHITSSKNKIGHKKPSYALVRDENMKSLSARIYFVSIGKTVFLTKEQAEQKLKEMRADNG